MWQRYIDSQYRLPRGLIGRWIGRRMSQQHQPENQWTVNLLDVQPTDRVLEIGFGPGIAVQTVAERAPYGFVAGVDFSQTMVHAAQRRNAEAVRAGRVDLRCADAAHLPFAENAFDKAFSIHSIYFWPDALAGLREIYRVLKPSGLLILTILPRERWSADPTQPVGTPECKPYSGEELRDMLMQVGFTSTHIEADELHPEHRSNYSVIAHK